jgi:hypothetical protein
VLFGVRAMCWNFTGYSAHSVKISGCYYVSHFEQEILLSKYALYQHLRRNSSYPGTLAAKNYQSFRLILHVLHFELK